MDFWTESLYTDILLFGELNEIFLKMTGYRLYTRRSGVFNKTLFIEQETEKKFMESIFFQRRDLPRSSDCRICV